MFFLQMNEPMAQSRKLWLKASTRGTIREDVFTDNIREAIEFCSEEWARIGKAWVAGWDFVRIVYDEP